MEVKKEACSECGRDTHKLVAGVNQPVRMGDLLLATQAQGLHEMSDYIMGQILDFDKRSKK